MVLFRGFSLEWVSFPLACVAVASLTGTPHLIPGFLILLAGAASGSGPAACAVAGIYVLVLSDDFRGRVPALAATAFWFLANPSPGAVPIMGFCTGICLIQKSKTRFLLAGILAVPALAFMLPTPGMSGEPSPARCFVEQGHAWWKVPPVTLGTSGAVLSPPGPAGFTMELEVECGGVRDSLPVVMVAAGETSLCLPAGLHRITLELDDSDSVFVLPLRVHRPFSHPVAHVRAEAFW
jgi:hypothetical protein